jgi:glycosyltransferase involved in cell wall biosynthesis
MDRLKALDRRIQRIAHPGPARRLLRAAMTRSGIGRLLPGSLRAFWINRTIPAAVHRPGGQARVPQTGRVLTLVSHELTATGAPKLALEVAKTCLADGWTVVVVSPEDGPYRDLFVQAGTTVIVSPLTWGRASPVFDLARCSDVVLCNTIVAALLVRHGLPAPLVWYVHETDYIATFDRPGIDLKAAFRSARQIWAASPMVARSLAAFTDRAEVMGGTVEPVVPRSRPAGDAARLLVMGGIEPRKGQLGLAHATAMLGVREQAGLNLTIHGRETDPGYAAEVRQAAASLPCWHAGGALSPADALDTLAEADGVVIPSLDEPLSLVALEAMSAGKVVICTRACGIADFLTDGVDAFVGPDASPDSLALTLTRALQTRERWIEIGANARRRYEEEFSPRSFATRVNNRIQAAV